MEEFTPVASVEEFADGRRKTVQFDGREVAIFKIAEEFYAIENECPHQGAPLCEGHVDGEIVSCPWHGWQFDVRSGEFQLRKTLVQPQFAVRVVGDEVQVEVK